MLHVSYLYDCQALPCSSNRASESIVQAIDDAVRSLGNNRNSFCLLLSDAARYMTAAGTAPQTVSFHLCSTFIAQLCYENQVSLS